MPNSSDQTDAALNGRIDPMTKGEQVRDMTPVESVAAAFLAVASEREMIRGVPEVHNIGTGMPMTVLAFASHWWSEWNASGTPDEHPARAFSRAVRVGIPGQLPKKE